ncbi:thioredoxin TrxC [Alcanivorax sp. DP30]|uniref:thioredoxin TrxC n=1 Tax=Alcanivorax sp. DP30 TaxID=2606217 RepID=UPI0019289145|nr:thioredoxin TrxC [Alcanivorax sp. DP30]
MAIELTCSHCGTINRVPEERLRNNPVCGKCRHAILDGQPLSASDAGFQRLVDRNGLPLVLDFWASWCGPCQQFAPTFQATAGQFATQARFVKVDTERCPQTAARFQIRSIPTLMIIKNGKEIARLAGALPKAQFTQWVNQQLGVSA